MRDGGAWRWIGRGVEAPPVPWMWREFLEAVTTLVGRHGPRWSRRLILGRPLGAWIMALAWVALPIAIVGRVLVRYFG